MSTHVTTPQGRILFTAFEPSGDAHAAPVIRAIREHYPEREVVAFGGPRMREAGATILRETTAAAAMALGALSKVQQIRREIVWLRDWLKDNRVSIHVPVDSPAANFPICKVMRPHCDAILHLVAPQMWAWAGWRIRKMRRLSDHVMCLLPFEPDWYVPRGAPATFIGHPRMNRELDLDELDRIASTFPSGAPRIALLPGSRAQEIRMNLAPMVEIVSALRAEAPDLHALVCAADGDIASIAREIISPWPDHVTMDVGTSDAGIRWADCALAVSGTVTLDCTRQCTPLVGMYRISPFSRMIAKRLLKPGLRLLPNLVAGRAVVPEFVPYAGSVAPIVDAFRPIVLSSDERTRISTDLEDVRARFDGRTPDRDAARIICTFTRGETTPVQAAS